MVHLGILRSYQPGSLLPIGALVVFCFSFVACQSPVEGLAEEKQRPASIRAESEEYCRNAIAIYWSVSRASLPSSGRQAQIDSSDPVQALVDVRDYFDNFLMFDDEGVAVSFADLPNSSKMTFFDSWAVSHTSGVVENVGSGTIAEQLAIEELHSLNQAVSGSGVALETSEKSLGSRAADYSRRLSQSRAEQIAQRALARGSSSSTNRPFLLDQSALNNLRKHYRQGDIITGFGTFLEEDPTFGNGHDSIFTEAIANPQEIVPETVTGMTAIAGKGVIPDLAKRWCDSNDWIREVHIGTVRYKYWVWTKKFLGVPVAGEFRFHYPNTSDRNDAGRYARSYDGKPYVDNIAWPWLNLDDSVDFWCSKLVYKAWRRVDERYNLNQVYLAGGNLYPNKLISCNPDTYKDLHTYTITDN